MGATSLFTVPASSPQNDLLLTWNLLGACDCGLLHEHMATCTFPHLINRACMEASACRKALFLSSEQAMPPGVVPCLCTHPFVLAMCRGGDSLLRALLRSNTRAGLWHRPLTMDPEAACRMPADVLNAVLHHNSVGARNGSTGYESRRHLPCQPQSADGRALALHKVCKRLSKR